MFSREEPGGAGWSRVELAKGQCVLIKTASGETALRMLLQSPECSCCAVGPHACP